MNYGMRAAFYMLRRSVSCFRSFRHLRAGGAQIGREDIKARMTEEVALAVGGELAGASTTSSAGNCAGAGVGQATATVV